jgi:hypothetical protein
VREGGRGGGCNPPWSGLATTIALDVLPRGEAVAFLRDRLGRGDPAFDRLAEVLGDLPLALEQAAAYLEETTTPTGEYLSLLDTNAKDLFALGRPATTEQTIATTWTVSIQRLRQQTPAAEELLVLCAFLAPDDIPRSLPTSRPPMRCPRGSPRPCEPRLPTSRPSARCGATR